MSIAGRKQRLPIYIYRPLDKQYAQSSLFIQSCRIRNRQHQFDYSAGLRNDTTYIKSVASAVVTGNALICLSLIFVCSVLDCRLAYRYRGWGSGVMVIRI